MARLTNQVWNADAAELERLAARLRSADVLVLSTFRERDKSAVARAAWSAAAAEFHRLRRDFYDEDRPDTRAQDVRGGDRDAIEKAVRFLELGPRFFSLRVRERAPTPGAQDGATDGSAGAAVAGRIRSNA
jgi:hypothetical protein